VDTANRRTDERFPVHLVVSYANAAEFVNEYVENLSAGGLFIANAILALGSEIEVEVRLPGQGEWRVLAKPKFHVDVETAERQRRRPGTGLQITNKPPGFQDALLGYLLRLGRRRDVAVMVDPIPGAEGFAAAGYQIVALERESRFTVALAADDPPVIAAVVRPEQELAYKAAANEVGKGERVIVMKDPKDVGDVIARIDAFL
jgi:hypothetical protein